MNLIITGTTGFVGKTLVPYLKELDYGITALGRKELEAEINFEKMDSIIHLAGKAHDLKKTANPDEYFQVNFELTKKLYDAFLSSAVKKFIFISSVKAVADIVEGSLTEEVIPNPQTDYGKSKLMAEDYIKSQVLPAGKSYFILRPCMIHGPGNKGNLNLLYQFVKWGIPYPLAAFANQRSFLSVGNLCYVIKELLDKDISSGVYHVADDEALSTNEVVSILAQANGKKPSLWKISKAVIKGIAKLGNQLSLPLNEERLRKLTESYMVSNEKIVAAMGAPLPLKARDGLNETAKSFK